MSRSARKRQTRLTFDSLPPSSPASTGYNQHVPDRAALVRLDDPSPTKKRKVRDAPGASSRASSEISTQVRRESLPPTPDPTAPTQTSFGASAVSDDSDSGPVSLSTQRMSNRKKPEKGKQRKLEFGLTPVSPSNKPRNKGINNALPVKAGFFGSQKQRTTSADSSDEGESDQELPELPTAPKTKSKRKDKGKKRKSKKSISPDLEPEPEAAPESEPEQAAPKATEIHVNLEEDSDEDDVPMTPAANRRGLKRKRRPEPSSSPLIIDDNEDEDSDVVITGSRKRSQSAKKRAISVEPEQESSEEEPPSRSRKKLRRGKSSQMTTIDEEARRDLEDDLLDLATSGSDAEVRLQQKKKPTKRNARELALAQLKRKRQGGANTEATDEDHEDAEQDAEDDQSDVEEDYQDLEEDEEEDDIPQPSRTTRKQMFTQTEEDEDFVIEDDDAPLGAPTEAPTGVPIAFTRFASMKAKELFKFAIEWMVQKKLNPAFQISDEIYTLTFQKLDDEVRGLAGSKFTSSAWTPDFTFALQARPEIFYDRIDRSSSAHFLRDKCDACNRSGHPATYEVRFEGKPYHKETLEAVAPINDDSDSDSDSSISESSDKGGAAVNRDSQGRKILPEDTTFYLGKFCMSNAQTSHSLQHWRFHLYEWVVEYLEHAGYNTPDLIVKRDKWSTRKRRKYANKVVDRMQEEGKIKALYRDFKTEIDTARNAKQGRWDSSP